MPYNGNFYKPDFEAPSIQTPDWVQMPQSDTPDFSSLIQGLKKKMTPTTKGIEGGFTVPSTMPSAHEGGHIDPSTASKGMFGGGGGKSL